MDWRRSRLSNRLLHLKKSKNQPRHRSCQPDAKATTRNFHETRYSNAKQSSSTLLLISKGDESWVTSQISVKLEVYRSHKDATSNFEQELQTKLDVNLHFHFIQDDKFLLAKYLYTKVRRMSHPSAHNLLSLVFRRQFQFSSSFCSCFFHRLKWDADGTKVTHPCSSVGILAFYYKEQYQSSHIAISLLNCDCG